MKRKTRIVILSISLILIIIFYGIYLIHFRDSNLSDLTSDWGNFGDYINSVAPILTFINIFILIYTVSKQLEELEKQREELKKQRETLYYPNFSISGFPFQSMTNSVYVFNKIDKIPYLWVIDLNRPTLYYDVKDSFLLKLFNVGMGAAKNVNIKWEIDYFKLLEIMKKLINTERYKISENKIMTDTTSSVPRDLLKDGFDRREAISSYDINNSYEYSYNFILQSKSKDDYAYFEIPEVLIKINSIYFHELVKNNYDFDKLTMSDMLYANVKVTYYDIANNLIKSEFKIVFKIQYFNRINDNDYEIYGDIKIFPQKDLSNITLQ